MIPKKKRKVGLVMTICDVLDFIEKTGVSLQQVEACENFGHMKYTILYREAIKKLERELGIEYLQISKYHDLISLYFIMFFP